MARFVIMQAASEDLAFDHFNRLRNPHARVARAGEGRRRPYRFPARGASAARVVVAPSAPAPASRVPRRA